MIHSYLDNENLNVIPFEGMTNDEGKRHAYVCDMNLNISRWSKSAVDFFGLPSEYIENAGEVWAGHVHPDDRQRYLDDIAAVLSGEKDYHNLDYRARNAQGEYIVCTCKGKVMPSLNGNGQIFIGTIENHGISEKIDPITGLYNVFSFLKDAKYYCQSETDEDVSLMMVGINRFSDINRNYGFDYGNKLLKAFADELRTLDTKILNLYKIDGRKFCLVIPGHDREKASKLYSKIQENSKRGYDIDNNHISFSVSGGVVIINDRNVSEFSIQASLIYVFEQSSLNNHSELVFFTSDVIKEGAQNLSIMEDIRNSIFDNMNGFYLCFQPIIKADDGEICGMEALLRWNKKPHGEVPPGIFIPWLEDDPCFYDLGNWVIRQALTEAKKIIKIKPNFVVNVNVSAEQIERSGFRNSVKNILEELDFPPQNMCMELTERVVSLDLNFLREELNYFRNLGIQIALDDFGTGVSSLGLLLELPVDHLKIDRNFVKDINENKSEQVIVETISHCASGLDLDVCVEGVETTEMRDFLKRYNIDKHQGYLYSKPVTIDNFMNLLKESNK